MDASGHGKHMCIGFNDVKEAFTILDMGVHEQISEDVALLCADTAIMLAIMHLEDARKSMKRRMEVLNHEVS